MSFEALSSGIPALEFVIQRGVEAAILIPLILCFHHVMADRISPTVKHAIWFIFLLRLTIPEAPTSPFSLFNLPPWNHSSPIADLQFQPNPSALNVPAAINRPAFQREFGSNVAAPTSSPQEGQSSPPTKTHDAASPTSARQEVSQAIPPLPAPHLMPTIHEPQASAGAALPIEIPWIQMFAVIWAGGMLLIGLRVLTNSLVLFRRVNGVQPIQTPSFLQEVKACQRQIGLKTTITIYETEYVNSPAIFGFLHPRILLPKHALSSYSDRELTCVLLHEMAHSKRWDGLWNLWTTIIQILHWPNPLVWFAVRRIHGDREVAADYLALKKAPIKSATEYGETILKSLQASRKPTLIPGLIGMAENRSSLRRRFEMISNFERSRRYSKAALIFVIPLAIACLTDAQIVDQKNKQRQAPQHIIEVLAVDADTGQNLSGIDISYEFLPLSLNQRENKGTIKTDHRGLAEIPLTKPLGLAPVFTLAAVPSNGYVSQYRTWDSETGVWDQLPSKHEFRLAKGISIGGSILDEFGAPLPKVAVSVTAYGRSKSDDRRQNRSRLFVPFEAGIKTDRYGRWSCPGTPKAAEIFYVTLRKPNGAEHKLATSAMSDGRRSNHNGAPIDAQELFAKTSRVTFPQGKDIEIRVRDLSEQAIHGARVQELRGIPTPNLGTTLVTDHTGRVRFTERNAHELAYLVSHPEHATSSGIVALIEGHNTIEIVLPPKKPLIGTVVDLSGNAIPDAVIDLGTSANTAFFLDWSTTADQSGKFQWETAPTTRTFYRARARGYAAQVFEVSPSQRQVTVTMASRSKAKGKLAAHILDETTRRPIPEFSYSIVSSFGDIREKRVQGFDGKIEQEFSLDHYRHSPSGDRGELFYIIVRAPGYHETVSRPISRLETKSIHEILLRPSPPQYSTKGLQVLSPEGAPLSEVTLYLVGNYYSSKPYLPRAMEFRHKALRGQTVVRPPLEKLSFPDSILPLGFRGISILSPSGSLAIPASELDLSAGTLQLIPNGSVEGNFRVSHSPREGLRIGLRVIPAAADLFAGTFYTLTDSKGHFQFDNVPPGEYRLFRSNTRIHSFVSPEYYSRDIVVAAGKTTRVDYHLQGHQVRGRFTTLPNQENSNWQESKIFLFKNSDEQKPVLYPRQDQFVTRERYTEANRQHRRVHYPSPDRQSQLFPVEVTPEGQFVASSIPPGQYRLEADILQSLPPSPSGSFRKRLVGRTSLDVVVPQSSKETTVDLGTIQVDIRSSD